ncbi:MAG: carboxylating nicotinate-nucleotide diphosphorylase [Gammaproteobacteria bacterium]|nr:MAG: carboxylating nicotinate-nucleotide diphosphorylase [Gammaproteobacteria bacterium]
MLSDNSIQQTVRNALAEDIGDGDLTATLIPESDRASACIICREPAILCGAPWFEEVFNQLDYQGTIRWEYKEGEWVSSNQIICHLQGNTRALLTGERTALNFLQTLGGTATQARRYADAVKGTKTRILDTRKTLPGLRNAQKYAVKCGGCFNHRMGLYDGILVKENHIKAAGSIMAALEKIKPQSSDDILLEVEVETLAEMKEALAAGAKRLLLDNFSIDDLGTAVRYARGKTVLEASGGISLHDIKAVAETGIDYISVGDITKNVRAIDLSMQFDAV